MVGRYSACLPVVELGAACWFKPQTETPVQETITWIFRNRESGRQAFCA